MCVRNIAAKPTSPQLLTSLTLLRRSGEIEVEAVPTSITDAVLAAGGSFEDVPDETLLEFSAYLVEQVFKQLFPGGDFEDNTYKAAIATIGLLQRQTVAPTRYQYISGLLASDTVRVARDAFAQWVEKYYGTERMAELCAIRAEEGLSTYECAMDLADSAWVNGMYPMSTLVLASLSTIANDVGKEVRRFKEDPEKWLLEQARVASPVDVISIVSQLPVIASFNETSRTYAAGEGIAQVWLDMANRDPRAFEAPLAFDPDRADIVNSVTFNAIEGQVRGNDPDAASLVRVCPAYRFVLRMATALVKTMLPDEASLNALSAGLPLKDNDKYEAYTIGQLNIGAGDPIAEAFRNASAAYGLQEAQDILRDFDQETQACLFVNDIQLASLRAGNFFVEHGSFSDATRAVVEDDIVMRVPGLGVYYGAEDSLEVRSGKTRSDATS